MTDPTIDTASPSATAVESDAQRAMRLYAAGDLDGALDLGRRVLDDPCGVGRPLAVYLLGLIHLERGEAEAALPLLSQVLAQSPPLVETAHNLGVAFFALGREEEALDCFHQAIALDRRRLPGAGPPSWRRDDDGALVFDPGFRVTRDDAARATILHPLPADLPSEADRKRLE